MDLKLKIAASPFSINKAYYKRSNTRTQECRVWGDNVLHQLAPYEKNLIKLNKIVRQKLNKVNIKVEIIFLMPSFKLLTKSGKVSRLSNDLSNVEKLLIDLVFDKRFNDRGTPNLNLDDCLVCDLYSKKRISPDNNYYILIHISIQPNSILATDINFSSMT